tara:strand:- start:405 stop:1058 length:654 start_codon:yes stop_codon:yes gene_type:complete
MQKELTKRFLSSIVLIPLVLYCSIQGSLIFNLLILILFFLTCYEWHKMANKKKYYILGLIFLIFSYFSVYYIRNNVLDDGLFLFLLILLTCMFSDLGGYIFGKLFKGPKLTKISPKKTYSGMVGSFILSLLFSIIYLKFSNNFDFELGIDISSYLINVFLISGISQIGDITISYFKRLSNVKDTGKIIPGHGGILDRTDGMIFAFPFSFLLLKINLF